MLKSILVFAFAFFTVACTSDSESVKGDPELTAMAGQVDALYDAINKGDLLQSSTDRDRDGIKETLLNIKIELLRLSESSEPAREFRRLRTLLKEMETYQVLKEDRALIENLTSKVYATVEKVARSKGVSLEDFDWAMYSTRFSTGLAPFASVSTGAAWEAGWSLDESWVRVSGQDVKAWLIGPSCDLRDVRDPSFAIDHTLLINRNTGRFATDQFDRSLIMSTAFKAMVSTDYRDGAPETATWKRVDLGRMPNSDDFHSVTSQDVDLTPFKYSDNVTVAFLFDMDANKLGHHYLTWQIYGFYLQGAGVLPPCQARSRALMNQPMGEIAPYQQYVVGDPGGEWVKFAGSGRTYAKIGSNGKPIHTWLLSPKYKLRGQKFTKLVINETVRNPEWEKFRIKVSTDYNGGDPTLSTWTEIAHTPEKPVEQDKWKDLVTPSFDLTPYDGKDLVVAFEFENASATFPVIWEIERVQIIGQGEDIAMEPYVIKKPEVQERK